MEDTVQAARDVAQRQRRALWLSIALSMLGELTILLVWGIFLYPAGDLATKFLWTVVVCGLGMGSTIGALLVLLVVGRLWGAAAIAASTVLSTLVLGVGCNLLCFQLDTHFFHSFGGAENSGLFLWNGVFMAAVGGAITGWLVFTDSGARILTRFGVRARCVYSGVL